MRGAMLVGAMTAVMLGWAPVAEAQVSGQAAGAGAPVVTTFGADLQEISGGALGGASVLFEGPRWGLALSMAGAYQSRSELASLGLASADLSYALIASPKLRLRLEAGLDSAHPYGFAMYGPRAGLSGKLALLGPLSLEGAVRVTVSPFLHSEAFSGLALSLGSFAFRAGYRSVLIDDQRALGADGQRREYRGYYGGLAFSL